MGKITIKHYLNKSLSNKEGKNVRQTIYVQVTVKRQVNRMRSRANKFAGLTEIELQSTQQELDNSLAGGLDMGLGRGLSMENSIIHDIITYLRPFDRDSFTLKAFTLIYEICTEEMLEVMSQAGKNFLRERMSDLWHQPFYILDWDKPYIELIGGLTELGEGNNAFNLTVLQDINIECFNIAIEHYGEFLDASFNYEYLVDDYKGFLAFYWFKGEHTRMYLTYLEKNGHISGSQVPVMKRIFDDMYDSVITTIKELSS
ncbi:hypothetical protein ACD591_05190 [Rufibacter glacialis]|nr:hypothetical protein [Rufibacter glacialis]GGK72050.1 hypothetical protein GCM10011405_20360 [Rufibacter glacialis]